MDKSKFQQSQQKRFNQKENMLNQQSTIDITQMIFTSKTVGTISLGVASP